MNINHIKNNEDLTFINEAHYFISSKLINLQYKNINLPSIEHILGVTKTLANFKADTLTIISSLVYVSIYIGVSKEELEEKFGCDIANIAYGVANINRDELCGNYKSNKDELEQLYSEYKKEPNNPVNFRIFFIKLAERFYNMQLASNRSLLEKLTITKDTLEILIPFASKFRLGFIKSKLEDLCLLYYNPRIYYEILRKLGGNTVLLQKDLNTMRENISLLLKDNNIQFKLTSRQKNIYSIYQKMSYKNKKFDDIYDVLALRIEVDSEEDCYEVLSLIHSNFQWYPDRYKNYIISPKENSYQALHTCIIGVNDRILEIQIVSRKMSLNNSKGLASYSKYELKKKQR